MLLLQTHLLKYITCTPRYTHTQDICLVSLRASMPTHVKIINFYITGTFIACYFLFQPVTKAMVYDLLSVGWSLATNQKK